MLSQIVAVVIFAAMFLLLVSERFRRHHVTLCCGGLTLLLVFIVCMGRPEIAWKVLNLECFAELSFWYSSGHGEPAVGINWETVCFIAGMMIMVEGMAESGFFRWLCMSIAKAVKYRPGAIFVIFMLLSAVLSMFIDSITVIMFLAAVTAELARLIKINPVSMILAEIFCANLGGAATMCGDPPNIIIGTSLGYTFFDFVSNTGIIVFISLLVIVPYFYLLMGRKLRAGAEIDYSRIPLPATAIRDRRGFAASCIIFLIAVAMLISHAATGLTVSSIGLFIAVLTLAVSGRKAPLLLKKVDWETVLFFIGLFVAVSGLELTGILELLAQLIQRLSGGSAVAVVIIIIWGSAIASAFVDNIPFAATMIPVIRTLSSLQGIDLSTLAWALSMGTDIGGSATPIGASANVVGTSIAARNGHPISWGRYCRIQLPATVIVLVISTIYMIVCYL